MEVLLYLALLACPLMMLFCMRGMRGMGTKATTSEQPRPEQRIAQLEAELARLRAARQQASIRQIAEARPAAERSGTRPAEQSGRPS